MNKKYQVFISSTFADLKQERQTVLRRILDLGQIPSGMEILPAADVEQLDYIKKVIDECDYYVLIIAARYGSMDEAGVSFTESEYDYAVEQKKVVLAFIHDDPGTISVNKSDTQPAAAEKLNTFRQKVSTGRLVSFWKTSEELELKVTISLTKAFQEVPGVGWIRGNAAASEELLVQLNDLHNLVDVLRADNEKLKAQIKPQLVEGIAPLSDTFFVRYSYTHFFDGIANNANDGIKLTWSEIFAACGPKLLHPVNPNVIGSAIIRYILENKIERTDMRMFDSDANQIKIQLLAHGLIKIEPAQASGGGGVAFASLTPKGNRLLLELLAVLGSATSAGN